MNIIMTKNKKVIVSIILYAIFCIVFFILHVIGLPGKNVWESWAQLAVISGMAFSYGFASYYILTSGEIQKKMLSIGAVTLIFFILLFFYMPHPGYILNDLSIYFFHGKIFTQYHQNPYTVEPLKFANDSDYHFVEMWKNQNFNYGPLWLLISSIPPVATKSIVIASALYKYLALLFYLGIVYFLYLIWERDAKKIFLFAINPIVLYWGVMGAHNDLAMIFFAICSLYFLKKEKLYRAVLFLACSVLIKYTAILLAPIFFVYIYKQHKLKNLIYPIAIFFAVIVAAYAPFGIGFERILGNKTLILPRLGGPLFTAMYAMANKGLMMNNHIFLQIKYIFFAIFALGYGVIFIKNWKTVSEYKNIFNISASILIWFYLCAYWFQAWYLIWIIPFLWMRDPLKHAIFSSALIWYGLSFYFLSYIYSSAFGFIAALLLFLPIFFIFTHINKSCFFKKN